MESQELVADAKTTVAKALLANLDEKISAAENALQQTKVAVPQNGICTPIIYPYGSCYEYMRHEHNWYYEILAKTEGKLRVNCDQYFAKDRKTLEKIIAGGCMRDLPHFHVMGWDPGYDVDGCLVMARYGLQARIEEERYANCVQNRAAIENAYRTAVERAQRELNESLDKKQTVITEIMQGALELVAQSIPDEL